MDNYIRLIEVLKDKYKELVNDSILIDKRTNMAITIISIIFSSCVVLLSTGIINNELLFNLFKVECVLLLINIIVFSLTIILLRERKGIPKLKFIDNLNIVPDDSISKPLIEGYENAIKDIECICYLKGKYFKISFYLLIISIFLYISLLVWWLFV